jgi:hypothetical protein
MALDMRALVATEFQMAELLEADENLTIGLQIGLNSGSIIAGVVGVSYPRFRLMGNCINVSSRMSTTCQKGDIQLSAATFERLPKHSFTTTPRGEVEVKGKGLMCTHYLHAHSYGGQPTRTQTRRASFGGTMAPRRSIVHSAHASRLTPTPYTPSMATPMTPGVTVSPPRSMRPRFDVASVGPPRSSVAGLFVPPPPSTAIEGPRPQPRPRC